MMDERLHGVKLINWLVSVILLLPAIIWLLNGIINLLGEGLYSYTFLLPSSFKIHTVTLIAITTFYITVLLTLKPHNPLRNFLVSTLLIFLSNALYEFVYFLFMCNVHILLPPPHHRHPARLPLPISMMLSIMVGPRSIIGLLLGMLLLLLLNLKFHFLRTDRVRILLFLLGFSGFITSMFTLNQMGFFRAVHLYLRRLTPRDPHNPIWMLSKILCIWMFLPLLDVGFSRGFKEFLRWVS